MTTDSGQTVKEYDSNGNPAYGNNSANYNRHVLDPGHYPDLQVTNLTVNPRRLRSLAALFTINWNDTNTGNAAVTSSFYDQVIVTNTSTGQVLASGDIYYDASAAGSGPIAASRRPHAPSNSRCPTALRASAT